MSKRILILGGSFLQIPLIELAKNRGYYVITCDYLPDNPGHNIAHEYHNVSTTDKESVLSLARKLKIDAIIAYASDPAVPTATYVSEVLGLPSCSDIAVTILANKDLFRDYLAQNGYNTPKAGVFNTFEQAKESLPTFNLPVMVKPVDSSGSKGISRVTNKSELYNSFNEAMKYTRCNKIIIEEFIKTKYPQIHGDGFVLNNELVFSCLGDHYFNKKKSTFVPVSTMLPTQCDPTSIKNGLEDINSILKSLKYGTGPVNIELMVGKNDAVYVMEIGPRNGGNFVPQLVHFATGADMVSWTLDSAMGTMRHNSSFFNSFSIDGFYSHYIIHSDIEGILDRVEIDDFIENKILMKKMYKNTNDVIQSFTGSNCTIGVLILKYNSLKEMHTVVKEMPNYLNVVLK